MNELVKHGELFKEKVTLNIPIGLREKIRRAAKARTTSMNQLVIDILERELSSDCRKATGLVENQLVYADGRIGQVMNFLYTDGNVVAVIRDIESEIISDVPVNEITPYLI